MMNFFEKFLTLFAVFTGRNFILLFENYSVKRTIENSKCGGKNLDDKSSRIRSSFVTRSCVRSLIN